MRNFYKLIIPINNYDFFRYFLTISTKHNVKMAINAYKGTPDSKVLLTLEMCIKSTITMTGAKDL